MTGIFLVFEVQTSTGPRRLKLGEGFKVAKSPKLLSELQHLLGPAATAAAPAPVSVG